MTVKELINELSKLPADAEVVGSGDEDAGPIYGLDYIPNCPYDELPYDGCGNMDGYVGKNIVVLYGEWN